MKQASVVSMRQRTRPQTTNVAGRSQPPLFAHVTLATSTSV